MFHCALNDTLFLDKMEAQCAIGAAYIILSFF